ncbi:MAG: galactokinase [Phycisphaerae bacterium]|nr:galactokinase [Phycisphaerae bacterium]
MSGVREHVRPVVERARALFKARFARLPDVVAVAPGRVNLIGEHVDYAEGFVMPIAIDRATAVAIGRTQELSRVISENVPTSDAFEIGCIERQIEPARAWSNYVRGPIAELVAPEFSHAMPLPNVDIAIASDVPVGAGLSSSAALEVATTVAAIALAGRTLDGVAIAQLCQRAEHRFAGTPCGIMDMMISANAREGHAMLLDCRTLAMRHLPIPSDMCVLVVDSGVRHRLAEGEYASRRAAVEQAARVVGVHTLRDATVESVMRAALDDTTRRRAMHVVTEIARTRDAAAALERGDTDTLGSLMHASHASMRDDFEISIDEIDTSVRAAEQVSGVFGARLTGGGFGGCAVALLTRDAVSAAERAIADCFVERFHRVPDMFVTGATDGARVV